MNSKSYMRISEIQVVKAKVTAIWKRLSPNKDPGHPNCEGQRKRNLYERDSNQFLNPETSNRIHDIQVAKDKENAIWDRDVYEPSKDAHLATEDLRQHETEVPAPSRLIMKVVILLSTGHFLIERLLSL